MSREEGWAVGAETGAMLGRLWTDCPHWKVIKWGGTDRSNLLSKHSDSDIPAISAWEFFMTKGCSAAQHMDPHVGQRKETAILLVIQMTHNQLEGAYPSRSSSTSGARPSPPPPWLAGTPAPPSPGGPGSTSWSWTSCSTWTPNSCPPSFSWRSKTRLAVWCSGRECSR